MLDDLMKYGYIETRDRDKVVLLREMYTELRHKGHALHFSEEIKDGQITKLSVYHYRSCVVCSPDRRLP
jgi:hypothetical protein